MKRFASVILYKDSKYNSVNMFTFKTPKRFCRLAKCLHKKTYIFEDKA